MSCYGGTPGAFRSQSHPGGRPFLELAARVPVAAMTEVFPLAAANEALQRLRCGEITGSAVLSVASESA